MHIDNLRKGGITRDRAVLSGGASNSDVWCQIFADVLNIQVLTAESSQAGALGTAANAAAAIGLYKDLEDSVSNMVKMDRIYYPGENSDTYQKKYEAFKELIVKLQAKN